MSDRADHWNDVYVRRAATEVSWYQREARVSLELIEACACPKSAPILDVGAGASTLADGLVARGHSDITLLDLADAALTETRRRLPDARIHYVVSDITSWKPARTYAIWHDRAVFHFLTSESDRAAYRNVLESALETRAHVILGTFAADGPERCSGLPVQRYSPAALAAEFAGLLEPVETRTERHVTPAGAEQPFTFVRFARV